jgi:hypothetical protein
LKLFFIHSALFPKYNLTALHIDLMVGWRAVSQI